MHLKLSPRQVLLRLVKFWVIFLFWVLCGHLHANEAVPTPEMEQYLTKAQSFIVSFKKDSAIHYATILVEALKEREMMETRFGLKGRLAYANALVLNRKGGEMMEFLWDVRELSKKHEVWDVYIESSLLIALVHENMGRAKKSLENMQLVKPVIEQYGIDSLYPYYTIQMASYHRIFSGNVDSSLYYARETIRATSLHNQPLREAWGNMLMAMLLRKTDEQTAISHYQAAAQLFLKIDDQKGYEGVYTNLASLYYQKGQLQKALAYNDTSIAILQGAFAKGYIDTLLIFQPYKFRAAIYKDLGRHDSAFYYLKKATDLELKYFVQEETAKVTEIDAKYNDEKRVQELQEQAFQLQLEKTKRNGIFGIAVIIFLSFSVLAFYFLRLRKANQKNQELAEQLKGLDKAKSRFFANVSHELRTPISLILGPINTLLKRESSDRENIQLLELAKKGGQNLQMLVNEILDLGKMESGKMELVQEPVRVADFFNQYFSQFESLGHQHGLSFGYEILVDKGSVALLDKKKCWQIVYNLLSNAFKFTPAGEQIQATLQLVDGQLHLAVADTGKGIHPSDLPHVFDRYFQTNRPDAAAEGGTGIGLALCKEYVQMFNGKIEVESPDPASGKGSVFRIVFPVVLSDNSVEETVPMENMAVLQPLAIPENTPSALPADDARPTILVVEDNPDLQQYIRFILEEQYNILSADNGATALQILNPQPPLTNDQSPITNHQSPMTNDQSPITIDLILSDLMMPVMDGYQLLEKLKTDEATRQLPVIMLTARAEKDDRLKALRIGVDDYLTKPFDEEELKVRIENLLANRAVRELMKQEPAQAAGEPALSKEDAEWLVNFETYVMAHLTSDILSITSLSQKFAMSESTLLRQLKRLTGLSPKKYLQEARLLKAMQLMEERTYSSLSRVASEAGYANIQSFSKGFKQRFGKSPSDMMPE